MATTTTTRRPVPQVRRGQHWAHGQLRYEVISVRDNVARCLARDEAGIPVRDDDGKAVICDFTTTWMRYIFTGIAPTITPTITPTIAGTVTPIVPSFTYKRPRSPLRAFADLARRVIRWLIPRSRRIAAIGTQALISGSLIASGILIGLNPAGAFLAFAGFCLACPHEQVETDEEYRQAVIAHFQARGQTPPRWTRREVTK